MYDFVSDFKPVEGEKPLDRYLPDGGLTSILRNVACIGDSLASGEFESCDDHNSVGYHDMFEFSWGQFLAHLAGIEVRNFSRGGMTAKEYMEDFAEYKGYWGDDKLCRAYIIALGVNDLLNSNTELGTIGDAGTDEPRDTFCWYYSQIIKKIKIIQPKARIFLMTMPRSGWEDGDAIREKHADLLLELSEKFEFTYVIDLFRYAPVYDSEFVSRFFLAGHMNAAGYLFTARIVASYIDYIIRNNWQDFSQISFVGTPWHNVHAKW